MQKEFITTWINALTGKDNKTLDIIRIGYFISMMAFIFFEYLEVTGKGAGVSGLTAGGASDDSRFESGVVALL